MPKKPEKAEKSELVTVEKGGERIDVHPLSLANHLQLGWKLVEPVAAETPSKADD